MNSGTTRIWNGTINVEMTGRNSMVRPGNRYLAKPNPAIAPKNTVAIACESEKIMLLVKYSHSGAISPASFELREPLEIVRQPVNRNGLDLVLRLEGRGGHEPERKREHRRGGRRDREKDGIAQEKAATRLGLSEHDVRARAEGGLPT